MNLILNGFIIEFLLSFGDNHEFGLEKHSECLGLQLINISDRGKRSINTYFNNRVMIKYIIFCKDSNWKPLQLALYY